MAFVRETYRAFWCDGRDISDPVVLKQLADKIGASTENIGAIDDESRQMGRAWESAWHRTGQAGVPLLVSPERELLVGCVPEEQVRRFFQGE